LIKLLKAWCGGHLSDGEMGVLVMLFFEGPHIEHVGENSHIVNDIVKLAGRQPLETIDDLLLDGRGGIPGENSPRFGQFNGDHPPVL